MKRSTDMLELDQYCLVLSDFFEQVRLYNISDWLNLASGIIDVNFDTTRFEESLDMCGTAYDNATEESGFNKRVVAELTKFSFVWGALESLIDVVHDGWGKNSNKESFRFIYNDISYSGKINYICFYLRNEFEGLGPIIYYNQILDSFFYLLSVNHSYKKLLDEAELKDFCGKSGIGISLVYKIRNRFAHGSLSISRYDDIYDETTSDDEIIKVSIRLVLLTIQMISIAYFKDKGVKYRYWDGVSGIVKEKYAWEHLRSIHIKNRPLDFEQMSLL